VRLNMTVEVNGKKNMSSAVADAQRPARPLLSRGRIVLSVFFKHFGDSRRRLFDIVHLDAFPVWDGLVRVDEVEVEPCRHIANPDRRRLSGALDERALKKIARPSHARMSGHHDPGARRWRPLLRDEVRADDSPRRE
jgi:hypothetical protein